MSTTPVNIHGTAIVIGTTGLLFVGPSGCGKSELAHACLSAAPGRGLFGRLVADDQVFIEARNGRIIARRPASIAGLMEVRGTGIASLPSLPHARLHYAVRPGLLSEMERLPEPALHPLIPGASLPLLHLAREAPDVLAILGRFIPFLDRNGCKQG